MLRGTIPRPGGMASRAQPDDHACLLTATLLGFTDPQSPGLTQAFYYLVGGANYCSAAPSGLGRDSFGAARPNPGCP